MRLFTASRTKKPSNIKNTLPARLPLPSDEFDVAPRPSDEIDLKDPVALGIFYHELNFIKLATYYFSISASKGHLDGLFFYAISLRHGWGISPNPEEAVRLLLMVAEMAQLQIEEGAKPQYLASQVNQRLSMASTSNASLRSSIMNGSHTVPPIGMSRTPSHGTLINGKEPNTLSGKGKGPLTSSHVSYKSALAGLGLAIFELSMCFRQGWGVPKDKLAATYYLNMAAELGDVDAQVEMGESYLRGDGVKPNKRLAAQWFRKAANQGARMVQMHWIWKEKYD